MVESPWLRSIRLDAAVSADSFWPRIAAEAQLIDLAGDLIQPAELSIKAPALGFDVLRLRILREGHCFAGPCADLLR